MLKISAREDSTVLSAARDDIVAPQSKQELFCYELRHLDKKENLMFKIRRTDLVVSGMFLLAVPLALAEEPVAQESAWEVMVSEDPAAAEEVGISRKERLLLQLLTPEQAERFAAGEDPSKIMLDDGTDLATVLAKRIHQPGSIYYPIDTCPLKGPGVPPDHLYPQGRTPIAVRSGRCGIPEEATAVVVNIKIPNPKSKGRMSLFPNNGRSFLGGHINFRRQMPFNNTVLVELCWENCGAGDLIVELSKNTEPERIRFHAFGYFAGPAWSDTADGQGIYYQGGDVGVGTGEPVSKLTVVDDDPNRITLTLANRDRASLMLEAPNRNESWTIVAPNSHWVGHPFQVQASSGHGLAIAHDTGNVGIGNLGSDFPDPHPISDKLVVKGTIRASEAVKTERVEAAQFQLAPGAAEGYVLTSDATGAGSWQPVPAGPDPQQLDTTTVSQTIGCNPAVRCFVTATCPAGTWKVTGGTCNWTGHKVGVQGRPAGEGWYCDDIGAGDDDGSVTAIAVCARLN